MAEQAAQTEATEQTDDAKAQENAAEASAAANKGDSRPEDKSDSPDLDSILKEFDESVDLSESSEKKSTPAKPDDLEERIQKAAEKVVERQNVQNRIDEDLKSAAKVIVGDLDNVEEGFAIAWLKELASDDKRVLNAWLQRDAKPAKYQEMLEGLGKRFSKMFQARPDPKLASDQAAVEAAMRGSHQPAREAPKGMDAKDVHAMSDHEFRKLKRSMGGAG